MSSFREALTHFRDSLHDAGEKNESPGLPGILAYEHQVRRVRLRWVAAAAMVLVLAAVGSYPTARQQRRAAEQARADALVLERVNAGLARPVPRAMAPLFKWAPRQRTADQENQ